MNWFRTNRSAIAVTLLVVLVAALLAGCARDTAPEGAKVASHASSYPPPGETPKAPEPRPMIPARLGRMELVGRWGYASYLRVEDRERTITAAEKTCANPYLIGQGEHGGLIMHLADQRDPQELFLKGSSEGYDYIGPEGPAGGEKDREVSSYDGRVLILRFVSPEVASRYGMSVYVKCSSVEPIAEEAGVAGEGPGAAESSAAGKGAATSKPSARRT